VLSAALLLLLLGGAQALRSGLHAYGRSRTAVLQVSLDELARSEKPVVVEIISRKPVGQQQQNKRADAKIVGAAYTVYKEQDAGTSSNRVVNIVTDSPLFKVLGFVFNPTSLLLVMYFSSIGWNQVLWLQKFFKIFGRGTLSKKQGDEGYVKPVEELPFQTFECEKCRMEMRPARGRAEAIFGRERFRCSRCGSKASAYFNVDDLSDPRAVARLERIKREQEEAAAGLGEDEDGEGSGDGDEDEGEGGDGDDDEPTPPPPPQRRPTKKF